MSIEDYHKKMKLRKTGIDVQKLEESKEKELKRVFGI